MFICCMFSGYSEKDVYTSRVIPAEGKLTSNEQEFRHHLSVTLTTSLSAFNFFTSLQMHYSAAGNESRLGVSFAKTMTSRSTVIHIYLFLIYLLTYNEAKSYHAVVVIHGVLTGSDSMELISNRIQEMHPGTPIYNTARFAGWSSLEPMWQQVEEIGMDVLSIAAAFPEGINVIGYSQGGLLARAILQRFPMHNVRNFISLSSPQAGQYGTRFLHLFFPDLVCETAYELFYSKLGQHTSVGNYWNDPHHQELYYKYSKFLPYVNNEIDVFNNSDYKTGLTKLKRMILIGGPNDGVITPWQSSHFGYYDNNNTVIEMRERSIYKDDTIGLKTLDKQGKLKIITVSGIPHAQWHKNVSIVDQFLLPYLD